MGSWRANRQPLASVSHPSPLGFDLAGLNRGKGRDFAIGTKFPHARPPARGLVGIGILQHEYVFAPDRDSGRRPRLLRLQDGFGFAVALVGLGLPRGDIPLALFAFNVGVELGQLAFIAVIFGAVYSIRLIVTIPRQATVASAYAIGIVAAFWCAQRLDAMFL